MKKLYTLLLLVVAGISGYSQAILSDNLNYPDNDLLTNNGWVAHSGGTTEAITVGEDNGLSYAGYSGVSGIMGAAEGNAAMLDNNGQDVSKTFDPIASGTIYYSFLVNVVNPTAGYFTHLRRNATTFAARVFVQPSATPNKVNFGISNTGTASFATTPTDFDLNTTYLIIIKYDVSTSGAVSMWIKSTGVPADEAAAGTPEVSTSGTGQNSIDGVSLRQFSATQNVIVDGIYVSTTWFGQTACALVLGAESTVCSNSTLGMDSYTASIPFTGGNSGTYNMSSNAGTIGGDNPSSTAEGTITISDIPEGTAVTLTITGDCAAVKTILSPECKPVNALPFSESFDYEVGSSLGTSQMWSNVNTGDAISVTAGSLNYTGVNSSANSVSFSGAGIDVSTKFEPVTSAPAGNMIYSSFLMNVTDYANVTTDGTQAYFAVLTDSDNGFLGRVFVKKSGAQYALGFTSATAATDSSYGSTLYNVGDVVLVVLGYDFDNNTFKMWANPTVATFTSATAATITDVPAAPITSIGGFLLRQADAATTPTITIDEVRIGTTTAQVLSVAQNTIDGLKMYPNPVVDGTLYINTAANAEKAVVIYDVVGKQVLNTKTSTGSVNVSSLNSGIYFVNITEEGKTATMKLVIR